MFSNNNMESLLLGALTYYGINQNEKENYKNDINYNSNIESQMNTIEAKQTEPEFFKQFDRLKFDNVGNPTAINQTYITNKGVNKNLQRELDFMEGFSEVENKNMTYNVSPQETFLHNNMIPSTARRDTFTNLESATRKYESLSGNDSNWKHKKEIETFFTPVKGNGLVTGVPAVVGDLSGRYITSFRNNNGALPFETNVRVLPGMGNQLSAPYPVVRVNPRSIDETRSESNQKKTYMNKPLETIKKGEMRGPDPSLSKFKLPTYKVVDFNDLIANKADVTGPRSKEEFVHMETLRGTNDDNRTGAPYNNSGQLMGTDTFTPAPVRKENYLNDFTHAINAVNTRPVFNNSESYTLYESERATTSDIGIASGPVNVNEGGYYKDKNDIAKKTMKQNNIINNNKLGMYSQESGNYVFSNDAILPITNRNTMNYDQVSNMKSNYQMPTVMNSDNAKQTIKETTLHQSRGYTSNQDYHGQNIYNDDLAKQTTRETTTFQTPSMNLSSLYQTGILDPNDEAKSTIRETTSIQTPSMNLSSLYQSGTVDPTDDAKQTVRQTTTYQTPSMNLTSRYQTGMVDPTDEAKQTVRQTTTYQTPSMNLTSRYQTGMVDPTDEAKQTVRQTTTYQTPSMNLSSLYQTGILDPTDEAKQTVRETTLFATPGQNISSVYESTYSTIDDARPTIRQSTLFSTPGQNISSLNEQSYATINDTRPTIRQTTLTSTPVQNIVSQIPANYTEIDELRPTIKQTVMYDSNQGPISFTNKGNHIDIKNLDTTLKETTLLENYIGNANNDIKAPRTEQAERNMTIDCRREITSISNRTSNGGADQIRGDINRDTVTFNDRRKVFGYVSNPGASLNHIVKPIGKIHTDKKTDLNGNNFYRIDPVYVDTLRNNPLLPKSGLN